MATLQVLEVDVTSCIGCFACQVACRAEHNPSGSHYRLRVQVVESWDPPTRQFVPSLCQQCEDAPCLEACPVGAIEDTPSGVLIDGDRCVGSGECVPACLYGAIVLDVARGQADKCDLCQARQERGEDPACMATCPAEAIHWVSVASEGVPNEQQWIPEIKPRTRYRGLGGLDGALRAINGGSER